MNTITEVRLGDNVWSAEGWRKADGTLNEEMTTAQEAAALRARESERKLPLTGVVRGPLPNM